ncbi:MAG: hypothetical protein ACI4ET_09550 [Bilifractor sp.]
MLKLLRKCEFFLRLFRIKGFGQQPVEQFIQPDKQQSPVEQADTALYTEAGYSGTGGEE